MSKDYIDRDALISDLIHNKSLYPAIVKNAIEDAPAADVVPVVRCKDCIYWHGDRVSGNCIADGLKTRFASDYCSKAVRKSDNSDHCVCCGDVIPEGRQVCSACEGGGEIADRSD